MLSAGIALSMASGVLLESDRTSVPYATIAVDGKSPQEVATAIMDKIGSQGESGGSGKVVTVTGLSGVGKGTTVNELKGMLLEARANGDGGGKVMCWSNGNIFRSLTMLLSLYMEANNLTDVQDAISGAGSSELKKEIMSMIKFEKNSRGDFDTHIVGLGVDYWVKDIETTVLKGPLVSGKIPTVAKSTQGEVVKFVRGAVESLTKEAGFDVIVEGRDETVDFIESSNRFTLVMKDGSVIGMRRAAQRLAGEVVKGGGWEGAEDAAVIELLKKALEKVVGGSSS